MISIDRKVCKDILKVTKDYKDQVFFSPDLGGYAIWHMCHPEKAELESSVPVSEVSGSLARLVERKMIRKIQGSYNGGTIFRINPELLHAKAFWFDRVTKTYVGGFVSGVLSTLLGGLLLHYFTGLP